jgi:hypothetical protein
MLSVVYGENNEIFGAWTSSEAYYYWKSGTAEEITARKVLIGNTAYLVITNSVIINPKSPNGYLQVPGGKWDIIDITSETNNTTVITIRSYQDQKSIGIIKVHFLNQDDIFFTAENLEPTLRYEFNQSFLEVGQKNVYHRCDIVEP